MLRGIAPTFFGRYVTTIRGRQQSPNLGLSMNRFIAMSAAAAAVLGSQPAWAVATASATITGFSYSLIDLNLTDGIAPAIIFSAQNSQISVNSGGLADSRFMAGWFNPLQAAMSSGVGMATGSVNATGARASASSTGTLTPGVAAYSNTNSYPVTASFTITPNTGIIFTTSFAGTASTTVGRVGNDSEYASAQGNLSINLNEANGGQYYSGNKNAYANYIFSAGSYAGQTNSFAGAVQLSYANFTSIPVTGFIYASASAYTQSSLPVPEPETWALMLAGLGTLVFVARRRHVNP